MLALEQGELSVAAYESKFVRLSYFTDNIFQTEERKARMFERELRPQIRRYLVSQRFHTLREVANAAIVQETKFLTSKGKDIFARATSKDKGKCKRPFGAVEQQAPQQRGPVT